jgi:ribosomal-protein-alanine N-acetyltransferase
VSAAGPRLRLEAPRAADRREFLAAVRRSRTLHRPWVQPPADAAAFGAYLDRCAGQDFDGLWLRDGLSGELLGVFNLSQIFGGNFRCAYLGYYVFAPHQGRGLMAAGLALVLRHAFRRRGLHRLEANVQPENLRSIALLRRAGFRREGFSPRYLKVGGRWRDHERYALLAEEARLAAAEKPSPR